MSAPDVFDGVEVPPWAEVKASGHPNGPWTFTIPAPCKFINLNSRTHWAPKAQMTKAWRTATYVAASNAKLPKGLGRVHIVAHVFKLTSRAYDVHNLMPTLKAAIDGLVTDYGLIPDDTNEYLIGPDLRQGGKGEPGVTITITLGDT